MILRNLVFSLLPLLLVASCNNRPGQPERPNIVFNFTTGQNRYDGKATCYQGGMLIIHDRFE